MPEQIKKILSAIQAEHLDGNLLDTVAIVVEQDQPKIVLNYPYPAASVGERAKKSIEAKLQEANICAVTIEVNSKIARRTTQGGADRVAGVLNVIAVASAKGGVGKSMVAANLALALQAEGAKAGLLDADIYGPSIAHMFGGGKPEIDEKDRLVPLERYGIRVLSMGHLIDPKQAMIWRGPMVVKALRQLLRDTAWDDLDFLILDMPPGTGDVQLSVAQNVPVAGAVIVSTPQQIALADAARGVNMFEKVSVPVLGLVANMATFKCTNCDTEHKLFGDGTDQFAKENNMELLAELPLDPVAGASKIPAVSDMPDSDFALKFRELATNVGVQLLKRPVDRGAKFPKIVAGS